MARRAQPNDTPERLRQSLAELLTNFAAELKKSDVRVKVIALVPAYHKLRDLGSSLLPKSETLSARNRIIAYLQRYPKTIIDGDELMVVSGIGEWARRVRELRVQFGWWIYSGVTFAHIASEQAEDAAGLKTMLRVDPTKIRPDQYVLMSGKQDRQAAHRWNVLNEVRKRTVSVKNKIIEYFRRNVGEKITGEELKYLAKDKKEWALAPMNKDAQGHWKVGMSNTKLKMRVQVC